MTAHRPQDHTFVTRVFPFTCDVQVMHQQLSELTAQGGGDGPEAVTAAMDKLLELEWRPTASKMACIIADAPPHGIEARDGFPDGSPDGLDPLMIARQLVQQGIPLVCPDISHDWYLVDKFPVRRCSGAQPLLSVFISTSRICSPRPRADYHYAVDFFTALSRITAALILPLTSAHLLTQAIIGSALEQLDMCARLLFMRYAIHDSLAGTKSFAK